MPRLIVLLLLASCAKSAPVQAAPPTFSAGVRAVAKDPSLAKAPTPATGPGAAYLPPCVADLTLGMPMADVEPLHTMTAPDTLLDFRLQREQAFDAGPISNVTFYFDGDLPGHPLYELIVEWRIAPERDLWVKATLGAPNAGDQWSVPGLAWPVRAWVFDNRYVVAAGMPGTEWSE
jgi:hypothetical protein